MAPLGSFAVRPLNRDSSLAVFGRSSMAAVDVSAVDHRGSVDLAATNAADEGARASQNRLGWRKT